jgi:pimeloyl-ACP methyl ester carboxylesterase
MDTRKITVAGHAVEIAETGRGAPLLYLHGFADLHAASVEWLPFHETLARSFRVIAPAHPCCAGSDEDEDIETIDDLAFRYIETIDALGFDKVDVAGTCVGGWIAAELAVRYPERINRVALIGASGLFLREHPIGDLFWEMQALQGTIYAGLRRLLFADAAAPEALAMFPDSRTDPARELSRYKTMRFLSRIGFSPPYFYNRKLRDRLHRFAGPALLLWGERDRMVPPAHARAYEAGLSKAKLRLVPGAGHSPHVERPTETAAAIAAFFKPAPARKAAAKAPPKRKAAARPAVKRRAAKAKAKAKTRARVAPHKQAKRGGRRR